MNKRIVDIVLLVCFFSFPVCAEMRVWTDKKGNSIEAEYINRFSDKVALKTTDGRQIKVPISGLCAEDIKYLEESTPPSIEIEVDDNADTDEISSYSSDYSSYGYSRKREKVKCEATITKKSQDPSAMPLTAVMLVFVKDLKTDDLIVEHAVREEFSFKNKKSMTIASPISSLQFEDSSYSGKSGRKYEGYVVCVVNEKQELLAADGNHTLFENNVAKLMDAEKGWIYDDDLVLIEKPQERRKKRK